MAVEVVYIKTHTDWSDFLSLAPSRSPIDKMRLDVGRNPYFADGFMRPVLVKINGTPMARAVGFFDKGKIQFSKIPAATFDSVVMGKNAEADHALLKALESWASGWTAKILRGPVATDWDGRSGAGPEALPALQKFGFKPVMDILEFRYEVSKPLPTALEAKALTAKTNPLITVRALEINSHEELAAESLRIAEVYNDAWREAWNHAPVRPEEISFFLNSIADWIQPELLLIAEVQGEPAGIALCLPDHGRMSGVVDKLKWLAWQRNPLRGLTPKAAKLVAYGVRAKFKYLGLSSLLAWHLKEILPSRGFDTLLTGPVAADRKSALRMLESAELRDKRQVYEKIIAG